MFGPDIFAPAARNPVRLFMLLYGMTLAAQLLCNFRDQWLFFQTQPARVYGPALPLLGRWQMPVLCGWQFLAAGVGLILALLTAAAGVFPRAALLLALVAYFLYFSQIMPLAYVQRKTHTIPLVLLVLLFAPGVGQTLHEPAPLWPLWLIKCVLAQVYFAAGVNKLRHAGWRWAAGPSLQAFLTEHYLWGDRPAALWLAQRPRWCTALSVATLAFELTFWLVLFVPQLAFFYAPAGLAFHAGTWLTMRINYLKYLGPAYLVFVVGPVSDML